MTSRAQGALLLVLGLVVLILALSADSIGIGSNPGFGLLQAVLAVIGVAVAVLGVVRLRSPAEPPGGGDRPPDGER